MFSSTSSLFYIAAFVACPTCNVARPMAAEAYVIPPLSTHRRSTERPNTVGIHAQAMTAMYAAARPAGAGTGAVKEPPAPAIAAVPTITEREEALGEYNATQEDKIPPELQEMSAEQIKNRLVDLLPRMTGTPDEFRIVENYINALEDKYVPVQTLQFLNLAMGGEWQLLFSTNLLGALSPRLRLRELVQQVETDNLEGSVVNVARWDLSENGDGTFDASGTLSVKCSYVINQGARMNINLQEHVLELAKGCSIPSDPQGLVGMLGRAMPSELFDPNDLAIDTTYLDSNIRIVRMTGDRFEGVRNVFIRSGSVEVDPTARIEE